MQNFAVIYRDNTTFAKYMPGVVDAMKGVGCEISLTVFPEGTPESEIAQLPVAEGFKILCDDTFLRAKKESGQPLENVYYTVDYFLKDLPRAALRKKGHGNTIGDGAKAAFEAVVREVLANGAPEPQEIVVASSNMADHLSYRDYPSEKPLPTEVANEVAGWCREIFPGINVRVTPGMQSVPKGWLVADRHHCRTYGLRAKVTIRLPLETAVHDLAEQGFLKIPEDLKATLEESILKLFRLSKEG